MLELNCIKPILNKSDSILYVRFIAQRRDGNYNIEFYVNYKEATYV